MRYFNDRQTQKQKDMGKTITVLYSLLAFGGVGGNKSRSDQVLDVKCHQPLLVALRVEHHPQVIQDQMSNQSDR